MMANRQRAEARRKAQAKAARADGASGGPWVIISLIVVVVIGVGIAIFATGGDDTSTSTASGSVDVTTGELPVSQPVTVTGDVLGLFDSSLGSDPAVGTKAPVLTGLDFQGDQVVIDAAADGPYMLVFLAHWCSHCNAEVPRLLDWKAQGAVPPELKVIGIGTAVSESAPNYPPGKWFSDKGWSWPVMVDEAEGDGTAGKAAKAFGASGWPYFVIVGKDGLVKARVSGEVEIADLKVIVEGALAS